MSKHLLIAVQHELLDTEELVDISKTAIDYAIKSGLNHISSGIPKRNVFIIHGRDEISLSKLYSLIERQGFTPENLSKQTNLGGETIIESLERLLPEASLIFTLYT